MKRTGFIAIVGRANTGKSTLLNALLGEKIAITSKKPQTTRTRITGVLTKGEDQYVFLDTPGMHIPKTRLGSTMVKAVNGAIASVDAALLVVDTGYDPGDIEEDILKKLANYSLPVILVLNKTDKTDAARIGETIAAYSKLQDFVSIVPISALKEDGVDIVLRESSAFMRESAWFFEEDALTDQHEVQIASEIIREKLLRLLEDELPHGVAVMIEEFKESKSGLSIRAEIFCERETHKGMIIGKHGALLKKIGTYAREDMEKFFGVGVYLDLWVKVKENWRNNEFMINSFGLRRDD